MNVFELFATLGLDTSQYDSALSGAEASANSFGSTLSTGFATAARVGAVAMAATTTAVVAGSAAFVNGVSDVAEYADNIDKMSQKLGMSAEAYQEWDFIMQHAGTSIESMQASMKTLASAAESGNAAFETLGMTQEQIASMSQEELFGATIEALQNVQDDTQRTYLAGQLLGRGATELGALLNMSAEDVENMRQEVHDLGGVMSDEAVSAGATFQDSLQNVQTALGGVRNNLLSDFLPSFSTVMDGLSAIFSGDQGGLELVRQGVSDFAAQMNETLPQFLQIGGEILGVLSQAIIDNLPTLISIGSDILGRIGDGIIQNLPTLLTSAVQIILRITQGLISAAPQLLSAGLEIISTLGSFLIENLPELMTTTTEIIVQLMQMLTDPENMSMMITTGLQLLMAVAEGLIEALPILVGVIPEIIGNLIIVITDNYPLILDTTIQLIGALGVAILSALASLMGTSLDEVASGLSIIGDTVSSKFDEIRQFFVDLWNNVTETVSNLWDDVTGFFNDGLDAAYDAVFGVLNSILDTFANIFDSAKQVVFDAIEYIKGLFDFEWSLPDLALPHFSIDGSFSLDPPSIPTIGVEWYARAMDTPIMLSNATIFGSAGGSLLGGGEAGDEMIYGRKNLLDDIASVVGVGNTYVFPIYFGNEKVEEIVVNSNQVNDFISGGRA